VSKLPSHHSFTCDCYYDIDDKPHSDPQCVALDAEVNDLKARLRELRRLRGFGDGGEYTRAKAFGKAVSRITDLRRKNWRKP